MSWAHSKATVILIGGVDISLPTNDSGLGRTAGFDKVTGYGKDSVVKAGTLKDAKFTLGGTYLVGSSNTPRTVFEGHVSETLACTRRPEGTGSGKPQQLFDAVLVDYSESAPVESYIKWTATLEVSDDIDDTAQS